MTKAAYKSVPCFVSKAVKAKSKAFKHFLFLPYGFFPCAEILSQRLLVSISKEHDKETIDHGGKRRKIHLFCGKCAFLSC